jgi:hypothetical protein
LIANKIPPETVTFLPLGTSDITYIVEAGTIDATMVQIPQNFLAGMKGFARSLPALTHIAPCKAADDDEGDDRRAARTRRNHSSDASSVALIRNGKRFAIEFIKGPTDSAGGDKSSNASMKRPFNTTLRRARSTRLQREMIEIAAQRIKPKTPVPPERVFDFRFAQRVGESFK